jgi:hypothetical protein
LFASSGARGADFGLAELFLAEFVLMDVLGEPCLAIVITSTFHSMRTQSLQGFI